MMRVFLATMLIFLFFTDPAATQEGGDQPQVAELDINDLLAKVDDLWRGSTSYSVMEMAVVTEHWQRTMKMRGWSIGSDKTLVRILEPAKDRDMATLMVNDNIWNYLPRLNKITKIPSSMMMGSWMGSHFTNDDLVKQSRYAEDYTARITNRGEHNGKPYIVVVLEPKEDAAVVWGKIKMTVQTEPLVPYSLVYYDEDGEKVRTMTFSEIKRIGERSVPMVMKVLPADKPRESTTVRYHELKFNIEVDEKIFSIQSLTQ